MSKKLNVKGASPRLEHLFEYFVYTLPKGDPKTRDRWADRIRSAASQPDFEFEPALRRFLVYALVGSKRYSALASVKKTSNPKKREVVNVIMRVAKDIRRGASDSQLNGAIKLAISALDTQKSYYSSYYDPNYETADNAIHVAYYAANSVQFKGQVPSAIAAYKVPPLASMAAGHAAIAATGRRSEYAAVKDPLTSEFAAALLYFVEQEAYGRGKRRGNPSTEKVPSLEKLLGTQKASSRTSNPSKKKTAKKKSAKKNPRLTPAQKDRRDRIYRMMRQGYEPSFADQAFLEAIGSQHRVRREYADVEIEKPRKQKGKGRIRVSLEGSKRENPSKRPMINGWEVDTYMSGPPHQWAARISDPNSSGVHLTRTVNKFQFNLNVHTADIEQYGSFIQFELTSSDPRFYESETISARKYGLVLEAPKLQVIKLLKAATWWADKKIPKKHNPSKRSNSKPKAKKKTAKKTTRKAPLAKTLIAKCQKNWDHYCERPSKKRLKEVFDHLEVMKESSAKTVNEERARCLRAANKEAKRLKMKK